MEKKNVLPSREALAALGLGLLVVASYFPAFSGGFIWDDVIFAEEPVIHKASGFWNIWFSPGDIKKEGHYWPLVYTSFWLEHKLWGLALALFTAGLVSKSVVVTLPAALPLLTLLNGL